MNKEKIKNIVVDYVKDNFSNFSEIDPVISKVSLKTNSYTKALNIKTKFLKPETLYSFTFVKIGKIKSVLRVVADKNGEIIKVNTSK